MCGYCLATNCQYLSSVSKNLAIQNPEIFTVTADDIDHLTFFRNILEYPTLVTARATPQRLGSSGSLSMEGTVLHNTYSIEAVKFESSKPYDFSIVVLVFCNLKEFL